MSDIHLSDSDIWIYVKICLFNLCKTVDPYVESYITRHPDFLNHHTHTRLYRNVSDSRLFRNSSKVFYEIVNNLFNELKRSIEWYRLDHIAQKTVILRSALIIRSMQIDLEVKFNPFYSKNGLSILDKFNKYTGWRDDILAITYDSYRVILDIIQGNRNDEDTADTV